MKNSRIIRTFEPDEDVEVMLKAAKENGLTVSEVLNKAMKKYGRQAIKEVANQGIERLKKLAATSFNEAGGQIASLTE